MQDALSAVAVEQVLTTRRLGRPTFYYGSVGSTNDVAHRRAAGGAPEGLLVLAEEQTAGRGRQDHKWWAPPGSSLLMSLLLRPSLPAGGAGQLTMCLGLGAIEGIEAITGLRPALKWPNDLLLDDRKLAGMLGELSLDGPRIDYAVLGLGLNVNLDFAAAYEEGSAQGSGASGVPANVVATATSLQMALGHPVDRLPLLAAILARSEAWYDHLLAGAPVHQAWSERLATLGQRIRVVLASSVIEGIAAGASPEGALLVRTDDGKVETIWAGDVSAVRRT